MMNSNKIGHENQKLNSKIYKIKNDKLNSSF